MNSFRSRVGLFLLLHGLVSCSVLAQLPANQDPVPTSPLLEIHRKAALNGGAVERLAYGRDLNEGILGRRNYNDAFKWLQAASQLGSTEATAWLGSMYLLGHGVAPDPIKAHELLTVAAAENDKIAYRFLGTMCEGGIVEKQDYLRAADYYRKASDLGDANSFDKRGMLRISGLGLGRSPKLAFALFTEGANRGDQWAQLHLAQMYRTGVGLPSNVPGTGRHPDFKQALTWFRAAAAQNNRVALFALGSMSQMGQGAPPDDTKAFEYFEMSAAHRYAPADVALGRAHELGRGTAVNLLHAYVGYSLASEQGDPQGINALRSLSLRLSASEVQQARNLLSDFKRLSGEDPQLSDAN